MKLIYAAFALALLAIPAVPALPGLCGTDCRINASTFPGYDPSVAIIESGSTVTWYNTDNTHVQRDQTIGTEECFVSYGEGRSDSEPVRFDIVDGALTATVAGSTATCRSAAGNGAGGFVLGYFCVLHPTMRGALVVTN